jgi:hypothetical protein
MTHQTQNLKPVMWVIYKEGKEGPLIEGVKYYVEALDKWTTDHSLATEYHDKEEVEKKIFFLSCREEDLGDRIKAVERVDGGTGPVSGTALTGMIGEITGAAIGVMGAALITNLMKK